MPGKTLMPLFGKTLLEQVLKRLEVIPADIKVVLTTIDCGYAFKKIAQESGWEIFYGDEQNVLKRFVDASDKYKVDMIIRATADNPLLSPEIAIETIDLFYKENCDLAYLSPVPYGSGVEVVRSDALKTALKNSNTPYHFEHVTPYIYENASKFKIRTLPFHDNSVSRSDVKLSVDSEEDFNRINLLFRSINKKKVNFKINSIIKVYDELKFNKYKRVLFISAFGDGFGMGHFKKVMLLAKNLSGDFNIYFSFKYGDKKKLSDIKGFDFNIIEYNNIFDYVEKEGVFERVIVDMRDTTTSQMRKYKELGPVISFDDMGEGGGISALNFKTIPALLEHGQKKFNYQGLQYLATDINKETASVKVKNIKNVLITFGGSDPENLSEKAALALSALGYSVTVVVGPFNEKKISFEIEKCKIVKSPDDLSDYIKKNDLVFTSFGITFFESLVLNKPVVIINPTEYHDRLTEDFKYPYLLKILKVKKNEVQDFNSDIKNIIERIVSENSGKKKQEEYPLFQFFSFNIGDNIKEIFKVIKEYKFTKNICPNCSMSHDEVYHRTKTWNMMKCPKCGIYYVNHLFDEGKKEIYGKKYFVDEYKAQYGKTYLQDKKNIVELAKKRIKIIKNYLDTGSLLDYGAGLGFFAELAESSGFKTLSIDKSNYAVKYIEEELNLRAVHGNTEYLSKNDEKFDVITSFYVIEHIKDFRKMLFLFKAHLNKKGVLVLSTPNGAGVTIKHDFNKYIEKHPEDHYLIFSPKNLKKLLKEFGFGNFKIVITGVHPTRFFSSEKILKLLGNKFLYWIFDFTAKMLKLGDTFEIYAQKIR